MVPKGLPHPLEPITDPQSRAKWLQSTLSDPIPFRSTLWEHQRVQVPNDMSIFNPLGC